MRCPDCNKFVSYDEPEPEVNDYDVDDGMVRGSVRVVLGCAECSGELKDAELEFEIEIDHDCSDAPAVDDYDPFRKQYEVSDCTAEFASRVQTTDRNGKPIKNFRYQRMYYGADISAEVKCLRCGEDFQVMTTVEEQASAFNELV